jgi:surface protein
MSTVITNDNIKDLVNTYLTNKNNLPENLRNIEIGQWNVSGVTDMNGLFQGRTKFNEALNDWNVSNVIIMASMFDSCTAFNQSLNKWDVRNVDDMSYMFEGCTNFNQSFFNEYLNRTWNVISVTKMASMFAYCENFDQELNNWNVSNVTDMNFMFYNAIKFNKPLNDWNVSNVTDMSFMFGACESFDQPLNAWTINPQANTSNMFEDCIISENNKPEIQRPIQVDAHQIHIEATKIKYNKLNKFLYEKSINLDDLNYPNYIKETINTFINESDESEQKKAEQRNGLQVIMNERLNNFNYNNLNYNNVNSDVRNSIFYCLNYVKSQSPIFKKTYVDTFIKDCLQAHEGDDGMSCVKGVVERCVFSLLPACVASQDNNDCSTIIPLITGLEEYILDWYKLHSPGYSTGSSSSSEEPFPTDEDGRRENLRQYLLKKFPGQEEMINEAIQKWADEMGYDDDAFTFKNKGGRRRKTMKRRTNRRRPNKRRKTMKRRKSNNRKTMKRRTTKRKTNKRKTRKM